MSQALSAVREQPEDSSMESREETMTANPQASKERVEKRVRRFELGFFIRKIVNGRVVRERQFPRGTASYSSPAAQPREETEAPEQFAASPMAMRTAGAAAPPPAPPPLPDAGAGDEGSDSEETTYEFGVFIHTSVTPPEYPNEPIKN